MIFFKKKSIRTTLLLVVTFTVLLPFFVLIIFTGTKFSEQSETISKEKATSLAYEFSKKIENNLNSSFGIIDAYSEIQNTLIKQQGKSGFSYEQLHAFNSDLLSKDQSASFIYSIFEPGYITDSSGINLNTNLTLISNYQSNNKISTLDIWKYSFKSNVIDTLKKGNGRMLLPPYFDYVAGDTILMITYGHALYDDKKIIGVTGIDIRIDWIQKYIQNNNIFNNAEICIYSDQGIINANNIDRKSIGENIKNYLKGFNEESKNIFLNNASIMNISGNYVFHQPVKFNNLETNWHIRIAVPEKEILKDSKNDLILRITIAILIGLFSFSITFYYFNKITIRISKLSDIAIKMANGELNHQIKFEQKDEIGELGNALQQIIHRFGDIIIGIKKTMEQLVISGNNLSDTAGKLSEGASEQASSTEEVSASMEEMSANIEQNVENAKIADSMAKKSASEIETSSNQVKTTASSMNEIANKTSIIDDIAFQINILALNAAVEAARAGVHGKGFGVVANEVGKLAERSKVAAQEIDDLTSKSSEIAKHSGISLEQIVPQIKRTAELVQDITNASIEQQAGSQQINNAIQQLNHVTQQNASSAELLASNVETLTSLADKLNGLIEFFKLDTEIFENKMPDFNQLDDSKSIGYDLFKDENQFESKEEKSFSDFLKKKEEAKNALQNTNQFIKKDIVKEKPELKAGEIKKSKTRGFDFDLGADELPDDGFEKF